MKLQNKFEIRCHAIGLIMTEPRSGIGLSKTCLSHVYAWIKSQPEFYGRNAHRASNKYCIKGNEMEPESINFAGRILGWPPETKKNEQRISNGWMNGECDVLLKQSVEDIKNSWSEKTFPLFDDEIPIDGYEWQLDGYMELYERMESGLVYTLMNAPERIIEREARKRQFELNMDDLTSELYEQIEYEMTFDHIPDHLRIKRFKRFYDHSRTMKIYSRVKEIQYFIDQLPEINHFDEFVIFD